MCVTYLQTGKIENCMTCLLEHSTKRKKWETLKGPQSISNNNNNDDKCMCLK